MTHHKLEAVLFDLDGTLLDTAPDFVIAVNQQRQQHQLEPLDEDKIRTTVSHGARALVSLSFGMHEGDDGFEDLRQELLHLYQQHLCVKTQPFDGINTLLDWLDDQSLPWGIVTNKPRLYAEPIIAGLNLDKRCQTLVCPDDVSHTKPNPEPMFLACSHINCNPENTLYLGDHLRDIEAGKKAGMKTIATNYGYIEPNENTKTWQADYYVDHADDIIPLLKAYFIFH